MKIHILNSIFAFFFIILFVFCIKSIDFFFTFISRKNYIESKECFYKNNALENKKSKIKKLLNTIYMNKGNSFSSKREIIKEENYKKRLLFFKQIGIKKKSNFLIFFKKLIFKNSGSSIVLLKGKMNFYKKVIYLISVRNKRPYLIIMNIFFKKNKKNIRNKFLTIISLIRNFENKVFLFNKNSNKYIYIEYLEN